MKKIETTQWNLIASLLSLDAVTPFHERMGLTWPDKPAFVTGLRNVIVSHRSQPSGSLDESMAQMIQSLFGPKTVTQFQNWATGVFMNVHEDQPEWSGWYLAFFRWVFGSKGNSLLVVSNVKPTIEKRFREIADYDPLKKDIEKVKGMPLSAWDIETCVKQGFDPADDIGDMFTPVVSTFEIHATQVFFQTVVSTFDERTKKLLHQEAQQMLTDMGIWMPGPLPTIDTMLRMLP